MDRRQFLLAGSALAATAALPHTAAAQGAVPARIGYIPIIGTAPVFVAQGEGWLKEAGRRLLAARRRCGRADAQQLPAFPIARGAPEHDTRSATAAQGVAACRQGDASSRGSVAAL